MLEKSETLDKLSLLFSNLGANVFEIYDTPHRGVVYMGFSADEPSIKKICEFAQDNNMRINIYSHKGNIQYKICITQHNILSIFGEL